MIEHDHELRDIRILRRGIRKFSKTENAFNILIDFKLLMKLTENIIFSKALTK